MRLLYRDVTCHGDGARCMQVVVRIRPLNARELGMGDTEVVTVSEEDVQSVLVGFTPCSLMHG